MDIFQPLIDVFNFIYSILDTIISGIFGILVIISSIINFILQITLILPNPLYPCFITFVSLYSVIFIFKIYRKG